MIRLALVDDDTLVTMSLKTIVEATGEIEVVAIGNSAEEAVTLYVESQPDILLMDIRMGTETGIVAAKRILANYPFAAILLLTTFSDDEYILEAIKIGVKGFLLKQNIEAIVPSIKAVSNGQSVFDDRIINRLPKLLQKNTAHSKVFLALNDREQSILLLVSEDLNNKEIGSKLFLSEGTVRNYISDLLEKLELRDRTQLAIFYYKTIQK